MFTGIGVGGWMEMNGLVFVFIVFIAFALGRPSLRLL